MKRSKSPGFDALLMEIFVVFWSFLGQKLLIAINCAIDKNVLHMSARRGITSPIPKKDRDPIRIKNWCPLTLLNTDYKILAKTLVNRMKPYTDSLIHSSQTGFMPGHC